jgi:hypothetical protein
VVVVKGEAKQVKVGNFSGELYQFWHQFEIFHDLFLRSSSSSTTIFFYQCI